MEIWKAIVLATAIMPGCEFAFSVPPSRATTVKGPSPERVERFIREHNGSAPPAKWYPNGDPWRNFTAEEADKLHEPDEQKIFIGNGG